MIKTHEVDLDISTFSEFVNSDHIILKNDDSIEAGDYVLFRQVDTSESEAVETGLHRMTRVAEIVQNEGLKDGYALIVVEKM